MRYLLFRAAVTGIRRAQAKAAWPLELDGYRREHYWYSGQPYWFAGDQRYDGHPLGHRRALDENSGAWYWVAQDGVELQAAGGGRLWDTQALW